jgi:hypothetical protein
VVGQRLGTREVRVSALLIGVDQAAVEAGRSWLESALNGGCGSGCEGDDLCFMAYVPDLSEAMGDYVTADVPLEQVFASVSLPDALPEDGEGEVDTPYPSSSLYPSGTTYPGTTLVGAGPVVETLSAEYTFTPNTANDAVTSPSVLFPLPCDEMFWTWRVTGTPRTVVVAEVLTETGLVNTVTYTLRAGVNQLEVGDRGVGERLAYTRLRVLTDDATLRLVSLAHTYRTPGDPNVCFDTASRRLRRVQCIAGPTVVEKYEAQSAFLLKVEFTLLAGTPFVYGATTPLLRTVNGTLTSAAAGVGYYEAEKTLPLCPRPTTSALVQDPDCPPVPLPPRAPVVSSSCTTLPTFYRPVVVDIPESVIPLWQDVVPVLSLTTGAKALRGVRVRFVPRPIPGQQPIDLDPCSACGSFGISYVPPFSTFTLDGTIERATITQPGNKTSSAAHLLTGVTDDDLFWWPAMTCGTGYLAVIETQGSTLADIALSVAVRQ